MKDEEMEQSGVDKTESWISCSDWTDVIHHKATLRGAGRKYLDVWMRVVDMSHHQRRENSI